MSIECAKPARDPRLPSPEGLTVISYGRSPEKRPVGFISQPRSG